MAVFLLGISFAGFNIFGSEDGCFAIVGHAVSVLLAKDEYYRMTAYVSSPWLWQLVSCAGYSSVLVMVVWT
jgi:hypothetical protein